MARVEKVDKWLDADEGLAKSEVGAKKPKLPSLADEINLKDSRRPVRKGPRTSGMNQFTRIQLLLKEAPDNPLFFGKKKLVIEEPKKGLFKRKKYPDLNKLRADLNTLTKEGKVDNLTRQKVRTDLKRHPDVPDLHVINAVYTYQDIPRSDNKGQISELAMNKLNEHQLTQLKKAIHEITLAFFHGGLSVFNVNWFMKIYIDYLNVYKGRLTYEYRGISQQSDRESIAMAKKLRHKQMEINELLQIKDRFGGINRLSRKLNGTTYLSDSFTPMEIRKAAQAMKAGEESKVIVEERRANKIIFVLMTVLFLLAKVPILKHMVEDILSYIPEEDNSFILRKRMVVTIMRMTEFELAQAGGEASAARQAANSLYAYCLETINRYLKHNVLYEHYEADPYLKAIWLVKSADGLFNRNSFKEMIHQANGFLKTIKGEANQLREKNREIVIDLANQYTFQLDAIMERYGWIGETESLSWQNRES